MKFIDGDRELKNLNDCWASKDAQLIVIYGRRRIGKTELIKHFIKDKPHIYFLAQQISEAENLKILGKIVGEYFDDLLLKEKGFDNWSIFFKYLKKHIRERLIIAIDEFPYLAESNKGISSIFQAGWDEHLKDLLIFLILCGSSLAMMEREVFSFKAPLYGRRTGQLRKKASLIDWERGKRKEYYCLFSKSGFTEALIKRTREERILLFHKDRMV